jgi:hypothetical protein
VKITIGIIMSIEKCASFFHDGSIFTIKHTGTTAVISMESAEIDKDEFDDSIALSKNDRIRGKLHIEGIKKIKLNKKPFSGLITKSYVDNDLLHLKIRKNIVLIEIGWRGSKPSQNDFSAYEIEAEKIWWENIPDLTLT